MLVPVPVQHQIAAKAPQLAYVPSRLAAAYRYKSWDTNGDVVRIIFTNAAGRSIVFTAARFAHGVCPAGRQKTFQLSGVKAYWGMVGSLQQAWRCVNRVRVAATTSLTTRQFADVGLGTIVASAHRIR